MSPFPPPAQSSVITLLSDFGSQDVYVGVLKGVMLQINPDLVFVDLTHEIPAQDIASASFQLKNAYAYFPKGTVHLAIVDPGVGAQQRRAVAIQTPESLLVGPDNGIFSQLLAQTPVIAAVELTQTAYWRTPTPSNTFHGRDIFAPVAAHLASGVELPVLGTPIPPATLVRLANPPATSIAGGWQGRVQAVDHFGNLVTNLPGEFVSGQTWRLQIGELLLQGRNTYSDVPTGRPVALVGSHGWVEIAVQGSSAQAQLQQQVGDLVWLFVD